MKNNEIPLLPNQIYHVYNHANGKENLFSNRGNYDFFLLRYQYFVSAIADTFAFCLMPNHFHIMVRIKPETDLQMANRSFVLAKSPQKNVEDLPTEDLPEFVSRVFGNLFSSYTQAYNKQQNRKGSLFMPNFKRKEVTDDAYFSQLIYYIHNNPVHHGFIENMQDWHYSSYNAYLSDKESKVAKTEGLAWFGDIKAFAQFHANPVMDYKSDIFSF